MPQNPASRLRVLFLGNHDVGASALEELFRRGHTVVGVVTVPADPNERQYYRSVAAIARQHGMEPIATENVNEPNLVLRFRQWAPDLITCISYRQILRQPIIGIPRLGVINLHGALLPRYRGGSPINWALIHGERETGVTIHFIDQGIDTGPIIAQRAIPIEFADTAVTLFEKVSRAGAALFSEVLGYFERGQVPTTPNRKEEGSYFRRRKPEDGVIAWNQPAESIYNLIRALVPPFPGAFTHAGSRKVTIEWGLPLAIRPSDAQPGEVFRFGNPPDVAIAAGSGAILPRRVAIDGADAGPPEELFARCGIEPGTVLGR